MDEEEVVMGCYGRREKTLFAKSNNSNISGRKGHVDAGIGAFNSISRKILQLPPIFKAPSRKVIYNMSTLPKVKDTRIVAELEALLLQQIRVMQSFMVWFHRFFH